MTTKYDPMCEQLARHFLADDPPVKEQEVTELACVIQLAVEDWWGSRPVESESKPEPHLSPPWTSK